MRSYIAVSIFALSASVLSAPTPQLGLGNTVGSLTGPLSGVTGTSNENGEPKVINGLVGDVTKSRVVGNARRQLTVPLVPGAIKAVDGVTGTLNTNGAVKGLKTDIHSKRQIEPAQDLVGEATGPVDTLTNGLDTADVNNINLKRGLPVAQSLPVAGGLTSTLDHVPAVGGVTDTVQGATGDLNPVTDAAFNAVKPVTDATSVLDARSPQLVDVGKTLGGLGNGNDDKAGNGNANGNTLFGNNNISL